MFGRKSDDAGRRGSRWRSGEGSGADRHHYAMVLMLTAVVSAAGNIATAIIEIGRSAGWWN